MKHCNNCDKDFDTTEVRCPVCLNTIKELELYLEQNCYSFLELSIGKHHAYEGIIIENSDGKFNFSYSERGNKSVVKSFETERELVVYSLIQLEQDQWSNAHIVAATFVLEEILEAEKQLNDFNIYFRRNDAPNFKSGMTRYRIFVFGKDILRLEDFKKKYLHS